MNREEFLNELEKIGIILSEKQEKQLEIYYKMLVDENKKINLTAITLKEDVYLKHFYDSLTLAMVEDFSKDLNIIDIGTGAGFPGLVLKIVFPNLNITLLDSLDKRIKFLDKVIEELDLKKIKTIHGRIEEYKQEKFDIVVSRAVAKTNILCELAIDLLKKEGNYIFLKSNIEEELEESKHAFEELNLRLVEKEEFFLPKEKSKRTIIKIKKISNAPKKYPRNFAKIKKNPL